MSEQIKETIATQLLREKREKLFGHTPSQDFDPVEAEKEFAALQRENHHLRVWIDALQLSAYAFLRRTVDSAEEIALFHGNVFVNIKKVLLGVGATEEEISGYMFGKCPDDDPAFVYANKCSEFALKAEEVQEAMTEMHEANDPFKKMAKDAERAKSEERKKTAN